MHACISHFIYSRFSSSNMLSLSSSEAEAYAGKAVQISLNSIQLASARGLLSSPHFPIVVPVKRNSQQVIIGLRSADGPAGCYDETIAYRNDDQLWFASSSSATRFSVSLVAVQRGVAQSVLNRSRTVADRVVVVVVVVGRSNTYISARPPQLAIQNGSPCRYKVGPASWKIARDGSSSNRKLLLLLLR
nr:uncharacterized protein LOC115256655 [Aedes albopictus]